MTQEICLDADIFLSCVLPGPQSKVCLNLLKHLLEEQFVFYEPASLPFEVTSVLRQKVRAHEITKMQASEALALVNELPLFLQWQEGLQVSALEIAHQLKANQTFQASYLAVAKARQIPCVSLDQSFLDKGARVYKKLYSPEKYLGKA